MNSSPALAAVSPAGSPQHAVAPAWHTVALLFVLLGLSLAGALTAQQALNRGRIVTYLIYHDD